MFIIDFKFNYNVIVLDNIIFFLQKAGGISVVWTELLSRLLLEFDCLCLMGKKKTNNVMAENLDIPLAKQIFWKNICLVVQRYLPLRLSFIKEPFVFHSSYYRYSTNKKAINITTVHDFTYEYFVHGIKAKIHAWQKKKAICHSDYIVCISQNTKCDLLKFIPNVDLNKIHVIYNGVSDDYYPIIERTPIKENKYLVFVGSRVSYKNFKLAVEAVAASPYNLVIVGASLSMKEKKYCNSKLKNGRYNCVGRVSNKELNVLYNNAFALLYPSSYEGFGIPVLEAQKAGCPVIAYNASSIPEIIGETPLLLKELSLLEIKRCFSILEDDFRRINIIRNGLKNAKRFTWDEMCKQYAKLYDKALLK